MSCAPVTTNYDARNGGIVREKRERSRLHKTYSNPTSTFLRSRDIRWLTLCILKNPCL